MDEEIFYKQLLDREEEAYQQLIERYSKLLWAVAATVITSKNQTSTMDIEEVVSDTFIRFWKNPEKFNPERGTLKNYLAVMSKSLAMNKLKQNQRNNLSYFTEDMFETLELPIVEEIEWQELYNAISALEEPTKEIFIRRFFYNEKPNTIQQKMNLTAKQVDNFLYRGKKKLRKQLNYQTFMKGVLNHEK